MRFISRLILLLTLVTTANAGLYQAGLNYVLLPPSRGGTGSNLATQNGAVVYSGPSSLKLTTVGTAGTILQSTGAGAPIWVSSSSMAGITSLNAQTGTTQVFANDTNVVITSASNTHSLGWASTLSMSRGGSGANLTAANGAIAYSSGSALTLLPAGTSGQILSSAGAGAPSWLSVVPIANGGTNNGSLGPVLGGVVYSDATKLNTLAAGTSGQVLTSTGGASPQWALAVDATKLPLAGGTMSGAINMGGFQVNNMADPSTGTDGATKSYVDNAVNGLTWKAAVQEASDAALPTNTYNNGASGVGATLTRVGNGALTVDGTLVTSGDRVLVKNEVAASHNGAYLVTATGSAGTPYILTRTTDFDGSPSTDVQQGDTFYVENGTVNSSTSWSVISAGPFTIGTTSINFSQVAGPGYIMAGTGISISGTTVSLITPVTIANGGTNNASLGPVLGGIVYTDATKEVVLAAGSSGQFLKSNGGGAPSWQAVPTPTPGGSNTMVQFNNSGAFGGDSGFEYNVSNQSVAIGSGNTASGASSFAQGDSNTASGPRAFAQGNTCLADSFNGHCEGGFNQATGAPNIHVEGENTIGSGSSCHAEGEGTQCTAQFAHSQGNTTVASADGADAGGQNSTASGQYSITRGNGTLAQGLNQAVFGQFNVGQGTSGSFVSGDSTLIIGNGASSGARANAFAVLNTGEARFYGSTSGYVGIKSPAAPTSHTIVPPTNAGAAGGLMYWSGADILSNLVAGTSGQVLTSGGAGAPAWQAPAATGITSLNSQTGGTQVFANDTNVVITSSNNTHTLGWASTLAVSRGGTGVGSYTSGSIPFSNGTVLTQDNANFFWDGTNHLLGIGVQPATNSFIDVVASTASATQTEQLTGYGTSNIGIHMRHARGTSGSPTALQTNDVLGFLGGRGYGASQFAAANTSSIKFMADENFTNTSNATSMVFSTTPTTSVTLAERMRISSGGNLLIGTTTDNGTDKLQVSGSANFSTALGISSGGTNNGSLGPVLGGIIYSDATKLNTLAAGTSGQLLSSGGAGAPSWITRQLNAQTGNTQVFANDTNVIVTSSNNTHTLGWASTLPLSRGGTGNSAFTSGKIPYSDGNILNQDTNLVWDGTNHRMGIGTTGPISTLHVTGVATFTGANNSTTVQIQTNVSNTGVTQGGIFDIDNLNSTVNTVGGINFKKYNTTPALAIAASILASHSVNTPGAESSYLLFATRNAGTLGEAMRIDNAGNLGIGTTAPGAKLDIAGQFRTSGTTATIGTCGTTPSITGTNQSGVFTVGTGTVTSCTVSFSTTLANAPSSCQITPSNSTAAVTGTTGAYVSSISTTAFVVTGLSLTGAGYYYQCY